MTLPAFKTDDDKARFLAAYDAALAAWPVPFEEIDVSTRLGRTHVIACGDPNAPPLLLLPSFAGTATVWRLNAEGLGRHFRTYAVDMIGQPGKSEAHGKIRNRREYAGWLADVLDALGVARASIVGCSFGGFLAVNQALETPDRVERIVLISPAGTFASQYWKLTYAMRIRAPALKLMRRLTGARRALTLADLGARRLPRDTLWASLIGVTMAEAPEVSVTNAVVFSRTQLRSIQAADVAADWRQGNALRTGFGVDAGKGTDAGIAGRERAPDADHIAAMAQPDDVNARVIHFLAPGLAEQAIAP